MGGRKDGGMGREMGGRDRERNEGREREREMREERERYGGRTDILISSLMLYCISKLLLLYYAFLCPIIHLSHSNSNLCH